MFATRVFTALAALAFFVASANAAAFIAGPGFACGPPNNVDAHAGSSCVFYDGSSVVSGTCVNQNGALTCVG